MGPDQGQNFLLFQKTDKIGPNNIDPVPDTSFY